MAHGDGAAVDVDLFAVDVEGLNIAQHHRCEGFIELEQIDIRQLHAGTLQHLLGDIHWTGQHHRRFGADIGKRADFRARFQVVLLAGFRVAEQNRARAVHDARRVAGMMHVVHRLDFRMRLHGHRIETAHRAHHGERRLQLRQ